MFGRVIAEKRGDGCTGCGVVVCADEELSKGSTRKGVPSRDEGYEALALVLMLEESISCGMYLFGYSVAFLE
jgi:hypothetical protein